MSPFQKSLWKEAQRCVRRGWGIVLIQGIADDPFAADKSERRSQGKRPITKNGVNDATTDLAKIKTWIKKHPNANIAIATGKKSGLLVLDVDPRNGGDKTLKQLKKTLGKLPATITSLTGGGGHHIFFRYPSFSVKKDNSGRSLGPGIDVQSDGCYVVVPPSRHASGGSYAWLEGSGPDEIELAELPEAWAKRLDKQARRDTEIKLNDPPVNAVLEGRRNNHLIQLGGGLRRLGNSPSVILAALLAENVEKCVPPLDEAEVKSIADSLARYPAGLISNTSSDIAYGIMEAFLDRHFEGGRTLLYSTDGGFWRYDVRVWILVQEEWLKGRILNFLEEMPHNSGRRHASTMAEVLNLLRAKLATADDVLRFRSDPPLVINCQNGELWITGDGDFELRPHAASSYLRSCLEIDYLPEAICPTYDATLKEILAGSINVTAMIRHWHALLRRLLTIAAATTVIPSRST